MAFWPLPNNPNVNPATPWVNNYLQSSKWPTSRSTWVLKFDHKLTAKHQVFVRANEGGAFFNFNYDFPGIATPGRNVVHRPNAGIAIDDTYLLSPSTVLDTRVGVAYGSEQQEPFSANFDLASLGFPQSFVNGLQNQNFPTIGVSGFESLGGVGWKQPARLQLLVAIEPLHPPRQALLKTACSSTSSAATSSMSRILPAASRLQLRQTGGPTANAPAAGTGLAMASFLLGYASGGSIDTAVAVSFSQYAIRLLLSG